jgi:hypothetical protein
VPLPTFPGLADEKKSITEDISIVERMQVGRRSPAMTGGVFSPALEDTTHSFQKTFVSDCRRREWSGSIAGHFGGCCDSSIALCEAPQAEEPRWRR